MLPGLVEQQEVLHLVMDGNVMPAAKFKPEHWATFLVAGMFLLLLYVCEKNGHNFLPYPFLAYGLCVIVRVRQHGKINPYLFNWSLKSIYSHGWIFLTFLFVLMTVSAIFDLP